MFTITARMNMRQLRHYFIALDDVVARASYYLVDGGGAFNRKCAMLYSGDVFNAIANQDFPTRYHRYVRRYAAWKKLMGRADEGFWNLQGDLLRSLSHYREDEGWFGGIAKGAMDQGGKSWHSTPGNLTGDPKPISMYAYVLEYGGDYGKGGFHLPRPLFTPLSKRFAESTWIEEANIMLESIGRQWA